MFSIAVIALAGLSVAYAQWSETLTTDAHVSTGELKLALTNFVCTDNDPPGEDVGEISCTLTDEGSDYIEFTISVENAYPGYVGNATFDLENTGTIPAYIYDVEIDGSPEYPEWATIDFDKLPNCDKKYINPGESFEDRSITVTIDDSNVDQSYSFTFTVIIKSIQWNYAP